MAFEEQLPQWENEGTQPPQSKRAEGWLPNEKPPASWFNWLFHRTYKALQELQEKAGERVDVEQAQQTADNAATAAANAQSDIDEIRSLGLGIDVDPRLSSDLNQEFNTGWVTTNSETLNTPPGFAHGVVRVERRLPNRVIQTFHYIVGTSPQIRIFTRVLGDDWSDWVQMLHTGNTTNIVNQNYETGTWTPVLEGLDVPGNHTYSLQRGNYQIIGDRIFVNGEVRIASGGFDPNISGGIVISGLPYAQRDSENDSVAFAIGLRNGIDPAKHVCGFMTRGENVLSLLSGWTDDRVRITHEDLSLPIHIAFSGHYRI